MENGSPPYGTGLNEQEDKKMPVVEELIRTEQDGTIILVITHWDRKQEVRF